MLSSAYACVSASARQDVRESGDVMVVGHGIYRFLGTLGHPVARVPGRQVARVPDGQVFDYSCLESIRYFLAFSHPTLFSKKKLRTHLSLRDTLKPCVRTFTLVTLGPVT